MIILKILYWLIALIIFTLIAHAWPDEERDMGSFFTNVFMSSLWIITLPVSWWLVKNDKI